MVLGAEERSLRGLFDKTEACQCPFVQCSCTQWVVKIIEICLVFSLLFIHFQSILHQNGTPDNQGLLLTSLRISYVIRPHCHLSFRLHYDTIM